MLLFPVLLALAIPALTMELPLASGQMRSLSGRLAWMAAVAPAAIFAAVLVALGIARLRAGWLAIGLVAISILVNAWGVYWGVTLGW